MGSVQQNTSEEALLTAMRSSNTIDLTGSVPAAVAVTPQQPAATNNTRHTRRPPPGTQKVKWNFVVNSMTSPDAVPAHPAWERIGELVGDDEPFAYACCSWETCPTTGRPHMQGFVYINKSTNPTNGIRESQVKDLLVPFVVPYYPHVSSADVIKGSTVVHCVKYVQGLVAEKGNTLNPTFREWGNYMDVPGLAKAKDEEEEANTVRLAESGNFADIPAPHKLRYYHSIKGLYQDAHQSRHVSDLAKPNTEWIWGRAGSGKTSHAIQQLRTEFGVECYRKQPDEKWWPAYPPGGDEVQLPVLIDDATVFNPKMFGLYKIWFDAYAFIGEIKHGSGKLRPKKIIITSQYHPSQVFRDRETLEAMMRRMKVYEYKRLSKPGEPYAFEKIYEPLTGTGDQDWAIANPCINNSSNGDLMEFNPPPNRTLVNPSDKFSAAAHRLWQTTHIAPVVMENALKQAFREEEEFVPSTPNQRTRPDTRGAPAKNPRVVVEKDVGVLQDGKVLEFTEEHASSTGTLPLPKDETYDEVAAQYVCSIDTVTGQIRKDPVLEAERIRVKSILEEINRAEIKRNVENGVFEI